MPRMGVRMRGWAFGCADGCSDAADGRSNATDGSAPSFFRVADYHGVGQLVFHNLEAVPDFDAADWFGDVTLFKPNSDLFRSPRENEARHRKHTLRTVDKAAAAYRGEMKRLPSELAAHLMKVSRASRACHACNDGGSSDEGV